MKRHIKNILKWYTIVFILGIIFVTTSILKGNKNVFRNVLIILILIIIIFGAIVFYEVKQRKRFSKLLHTISVDKEYYCNGQTICFDFKKRLVAILYYTNKSFYPNSCIVSFDNIKSKNVEVKRVGKKYFIFLSFNIKLDNEIIQKIEVTECFSKKTKKNKVEENINLDVIELSKTDEKMKRIADLMEIIDNIIFTNEKKLRIKQ